MWDEQKGQRYEELRKRQDSLTDAERAELAELTRELEALEASRMGGTAGNAGRSVAQWPLSDRPDEPPALQVWGGPAALICAAFAWLAAVLSCPQGSPTFLLGVVCALAAVIVGMVSRSKIGWLGVALGVLHLLVTLSCFCLATTGLFGPVWQD